MRQALHIFKKDVRRLSYEVAVSLLVVAAFIYLEIRPGIRGPDYLVNPFAASGLLRFLLPAAGWVLIARVIHAEALPGDRQFWRTRPYAWQSLLGAKALFILAFVNLPMLVADAIVLRAYGFSVLTELPGLLWSQILLTTVFVLPMAALSAVTTGFVQLLFTILVLSAALVARDIGTHRLIYDGAWGALEWIRTSYAVAVTTIAALAIVIWQYARRRTAAARFSIAAACVLVALGATLIPWTAAYAIQSRMSKQRIDQSSVQATFDWDRKWLGRVLMENGDRARIDLPLRIAGIPDGMEVKTDGFSVSIEAPDGTLWRSDEPRMPTDLEPRTPSQRFQVNGSVYRSIRNQPVRLRGSLYMTLFGNRKAASVPFRNRYVPAPGLGVCSASWGEEGKGNFLICRQAFRSSAGIVSVQFADFQAPTFRESPISYSPFPAELSISPLSQFFASSFREQLPAVTIVTLEPLAHIRRHFEIQGLRLSELEAR